MTTGGPFQIFIFNKEKKRVLHAVYPPHVCFSFSHISLPSSARSAGRHLNFEWGLGGGAYKRATEAPICREVWKNPAPDFFLNLEALKCYFRYLISFVI